MKTVVIHGYGGPEQLKFEEFPDPSVGPGDVLIRVIATSVNPFDVKLRSGAMKDVVPVRFPSILGIDVSGIVESTGDAVHTFAVGDHVAAHASQTYAQLCVVKASEMVKIPEGMETNEVAALPTVTTTGAQVADLALGSPASRVILVTGAVGNVGRSAVYELKRRGATVIAGVLKRQLEEALKIGADRVMALDDEAAMDSLEPLDGVADTVSGPVTKKLIGKIKNGGVFASVLGVPSNAGAYPNVQSKNMQVQPDPAGLRRMLEAVRDGQLTIPLGQRFALRDAAQAHAAAEKHAPGKLLLIA